MRECAASLTVDWSVNTRGDVPLDATLRIVWKQKTFCTSEIMLVMMLSESTLVAHSICFRFSFHIFRNLNSATAFLSIYVSFFRYFTVSESKI